MWNRGARPHGVGERDAAIGRRREVLGSSRRRVTADDAEAADAVAQAIEACRLELTQAIGNHAAPAAQARVEPVPEPDVDAVEQEMPSAAGA